MQEGHPSLRAASHETASLRGCRSSKPSQSARILFEIKSNRLRRRAVRLRIKEMLATVNAAIIRRPALANAALVLPTSGNCHLPIVVVFAGFGCQNIIKKTVMQHPGK
jgi:hypothetical protein